MLAQGTSGLDQPDSVEPTPTKRNRTTNACSGCKSRRVKCCGNNPCARCSRLSLDCSYPISLVKRGPKSTYGQDMLSMCLTHGPEESFPELANLANLEIRADLLTLFFKFYGPTFSVFRREVMIPLVQRDSSLLPLMYEILRMSQTVSPDIKRLTDIVESDHHTCVSLVSLLLLVFKGGSSRNISVGLYITNAIFTIARKLNLDFEDGTSTLPPQEVRIRRIIYYALVSMDIHIAYTAGIDFNLNASPDKVPYPLSTQIPVLVNFKDYSARCAFFSGLLTSTTESIQDSRYAYFMEYFSLFKSICQFIRHEARTIQKQKDASDLEKTRSRLNDELFIWFNHLPREYQVTASKYHEEEARGSLSWRMALMTAHYHHALIYLHLPCFTLSCQTKNYGFVKGDTFRSCLYSAIEIGKLAQVVSIQNPLGRFMPRGLSGCIAMACKLFAIACVSDSSFKFEETMRTCLGIVQTLKEDGGLGYRDEQVILQCLAFKDETFLVTPTMSMIDEFRKCGLTGSQ